MLSVPGRKCQPAQDTHLAAAVAPSIRYSLPDSGGLPQLPPARLRPFQHYRVVNKDSQKPSFKNMAVRLRLALIVPPNTWYQTSEATALLPVFHEKTSAVSPLFYFMQIKDVPKAINHSLGPAAPFGGLGG